MDSTGYDLARGRVTITRNGFAYDLSADWDAAAHADGFVGDAEVTAAQPWPLDPAMPRNRAERRATARRTTRQDRDATRPRGSKP